MYLAAATYSLSEIMDVSMMKSETPYLTFFLQLLCRPKISTFVDFLLKEPRAKEGSDVRPKGIDDTA